jgi:hypothetical protein
MALLCLFHTLCAAVLCAQNSASEEPLAIVAWKQLLHRMPEKNTYADQRRWY